MQEMKGMLVQSLSREDPLEEGMATHSSIFAWRISWTEEPGGLAESQTGLSDSASIDNGSRQLFPQPSLSWPVGRFPGSLEPSWRRECAVTIVRSGQLRSVPGSESFPSFSAGPLGLQSDPLHCAFKRRVPTRPYLPWHPRFSKLATWVELSPVKKLSQNKNKNKTKTHLFIFWSCNMACRILVPQPGIEPGPQQWNLWVLTTVPSGNSPKASSLIFTLPAFLYFQSWVRSPRDVKWGFFGVNSEDGHLAYHNIISH